MKTFRQRFLGYILTDFAEILQAPNYDLVEGRIEGALRSDEYFDHFVQQN